MVQDIEQFVCPFTRPIVKGKRYRPAPAAAAIDRRPEQRRRTASDSVSHASARRTHRAPYGYTVHRQNCNTAAREHGEEEASLYCRGAAAWCMVDAGKPICA